MEGVMIIGSTGCGGARAGVWLGLILFPLLSFGQASFQGQIRGVVRDQSGAVIPGAKVTITNVATNISSSSQTDDRGYYIFNGLHPARYTVAAEANGFQIKTEKDVVLAVSQQTTIDFTLVPAGLTSSVTVTESTPLLDSGNSALGTDVNGTYTRDIPLYGRSYFGLVFLAGGVSEVSGAGISDNYPTGTNFVSNGQRNATAEIRLDGAPISAPEQGEGATSNVYYQPSVETIQEFKVENNSFSAEFGNNGGTVVNIVMKSGGNLFHGSGWWFGQRSALDANDFFSNAAGIPMADHTHNQYGGLVSGPIKKNKLFFLVDLERSTDTSPTQISATVPTDLQRKGDFSQTNTYDTNGNPVLQQIFNPFSLSSSGNRAAFPGNVIPSSLLDPIALNIMKLYPEPNLAGDPVSGTNNYRANVPSTSEGYQYDVKLDYQWNDKNHTSGRYSMSHNLFQTPTVFGDNDGVWYLTDARNAVVEHDWTLSPRILITSRLSLDRAYGPGKTPNYPDPTKLGFPPILDAANGIVRMPTIDMDTPWTPLFTQCCVDTKFAHTLYTYSSSLSWVKGSHSMKFGGEQRLFYNNFQQVPYPTGYFHFAQNVTAQQPYSGDTTQGNSIASLLVGYGDYGTIAIYPAVANKSKETGFYVQDDWKVTPKLTVNLGLRYEWSTPYSDRFNRLEFSDFTGDSGITVPGISGSLKGVTEFATGSMRNLPVDRNNWAPRLGIAYALNSKTVIRAGAGVYYGMNVATNFQYPGTAFRKDGSIHFTLDGFQTQYATLENPFPTGLPMPQGTKYGKLAEWGFGNGNDLGTRAARNAEIYQWNAGVQRLLPSNFVIGVDYSANRSTHLPWNGYSSTRNRNFIPSAIRKQYTSDQLNSLVDNPFLPMFSGPNAIFNEPDSIYNNAQIPLINLLRPYPQFDGSFEGLPALVATSWYHSMQLRFERKAGFITFQGNYTLSKATDTSSAGANPFVGNLNNGNPQELDNLRAEHGIGANDATHRLAFAAVLEIPIGRGRWLGNRMNRVADAAIGGWSLSSSVTFQSGQPLFVTLVNPRIADGSQRPDITCPHPGTGISYHHAAATGESIFNLACFADPGDQQPGNAPRYLSYLRLDGIHNIDLSLRKSFVPREGTRLEVRVESFNATNTTRFGNPDTAYGSPTFGQVFNLGPGFAPKRTQIVARFEF
jgi:hypothetical protein